MEGLIQQPVIWSASMLAIGCLASLIGGALAGIAIGGKQFGIELGAQMGGLFGLLVGVPGVALALLILTLLG